MSEVRGREFYRYMSRAEATAIGKPGDTGFLRGGRPGETYWTSEWYETAREAKERLALEDMPEVRMRFTMLAWPSRMLREGSTVSPTYKEPGGGIEWMTDERVEVRVVDVHDFTR